MKERTFVDHNPGVEYFLEQPLPTKTINHLLNSFDQNSFLTLASYKCLALIGAMATKEASSIKQMMFFWGIAAFCLEMSYPIPRLSYSEDSLYIMFRIISCTTARATVAITARSRTPAVFWFGSVISSAISYVSSVMIIWGIYIYDWLVCLVLGFTDRDDRD